MHIRHGGFSTPVKQAEPVEIHILVCNSPTTCSLKTPAIEKFANLLASITEKGTLFFLQISAMHLMSFRCLFHYDIEKAFLYNQFDESSSWQETLKHLPPIERIFYQHEWQSQMNHTEISYSQDSKTKTSRRKNSKIVTLYCSNSEIILKGD